MEFSDLDFKIITAFLIDRKGHRWIETNLLNEPSGNLGFKARKKLMQFNLHGDFKDLLADIQSDEEFEEILISKKQLISQSKLDNNDLRLIWNHSQQVYLFQRVIRNNDGWIRPSAGRLGFDRDGDYLKENGFGHEDWNFNTGLAIDGYVYGYRYGAPAIGKLSKKFNIVFCERLSDGWAIVGYYLNATFEPNGSPESLEVINQKVKDLQTLRRMRSIGKQWDIDENKMKTRVRKELDALGWKVKIEDVFSFLNPVAIPKNFDLPKNDRITTSTGITYRLFNSLIELKPTAQVEDDEMFFPEGKVKWAQHRKKERNGDVPRKAKEAFFKRHGRFFCEVCGFDFVEMYGGIGSNFIEAHHLIPVSDYDDEGEETSIKDIVLLCSNCHRMIHRKRPWLKVDDLKMLLTDKAL